MSPGDFADRARADILTIGGETMGTDWSVRFVPTATASPKRVEALVAETLARLIAELSHWEAESAVSRFNRAPVGVWRLLSPALHIVLEAGLAVAKASQGAFDPAVGRLVDLWGFGPGGPCAGPPDAVRIAEAMAGGWRSIERNGQFARRIADATLDFSGIGKGHAVDAIAEALVSAGVRHLLVEIGGELRGVGIRPDGQPWWVDVEAPPGTALAPIRIALHRLSVATSGDYRRWRDSGGERSTHSIDPRTGRPIANQVASTTVLGPTCMLADAWATALTVLGPRDGMALASGLGLCAHMVARDDDAGGVREWLSPRFQLMLD